MRFAGAQAGQVRRQEAPDIQADPSQTESPDLQFQQRDQRYRLRKSDVIEIKFRLSPEFDQTVTIQPDGFITLDGAGDIKVEDKTLPELKEADPTGVSGHSP